MMHTRFSLSNGLDFGDAESRTSVADQKSTSFAGITKDCLKPMDEEPVREALTSFRKSTEPRSLSRRIRRVFADITVLQWQPLSKNPSLDSIKKSIPLLFETVKRFQSTMFKEAAIRQQPLVYQQADPLVDKQFFYSFSLDREGNTPPLANLSNAGRQRHAQLLLAALESNIALGAVGLGLQHAILVVVPLLGITEV